MARPAWDQVPLISTPFDQYQRYRIVSELTWALAGPASDPGALRVLDVGGHHTDFWGRARRPIAEALPEFRTFTIDLAPNATRGYVRAHGGALPFQDVSFDLVTSADVLEHVPSSARPALLSELARTSSRAIVLAAPFSDPLVERAERLLSEFIETTNGYVQGQLREHRTYGLPDLRETESWFADNGWHVLTFPYGNLWRWLFMMVDKHGVAALPGSRTLHETLDEAYNRRFFASDDEPPCYRHFLVAARREDDELLAFAQRRFAASRPKGLPPPGETRQPRAAEASLPLLGETSLTRPGEASLPPREQVDASELMFKLAEIHAANQHLIAKGEPQRRTEQVLEVEEHRAAVLRTIDAQAEYIAKLEGQLREVERSLTFRLNQTLRRLFPKL